MQSSIVISKLIVITAAAAIVTNSTPAVAGGNGTTITVIGERPTALISYAGLNLASSAGVEALNGRVRGAARSLCIGTGVESLEARMEGKACHRQVLQDAAKQIELAVAKGDQRFAERKAVVVGVR